jgi:beta-phosphoglucomutase-like phosphatase (HAD superfamily)
MKTDDHHSYWRRRLALLREARDRDQLKTFFAKEDAREFEAFAEDIAEDVFENFPNRAADESIREGARDLIELLEKEIPLMFVSHEENASRIVAELLRSVVYAEVVNLAAFRDLASNAALILAQSFCAKQRMKNEPKGRRTR